MRKISSITIVLILAFSSLSAQVFEGMRNSMFSDIKAHNTGDVITVLIVEQTKAEQNSQSEN
ncbi:MAG: flagellar basal body L-ring protein FlgH, partial [Bacteroidota bacterium]